MLWPLMFRSLFARKPSTSINRKSRRYRPAVELLEARLAPAIFTVANLNDAGGGSLRGAILSANADNIADTINFAAGLTGTITLGGTELAITQPLTITGPGPGVLKIDANNASRIFNVSDNLVGTNLVVAISGLTLTRGVGTDGGAILNDESLTVTNATLTANSATNVSGGGGGIVNRGSLNVANSKLAGNSATMGGGIFNVSGSLRVGNSTLSGNSATTGGGIFNVSGSLNVINSTLSGNSVGNGGNGGGINNDSGMLNVTNSTLSGNSADGRGGGIFNSSGALTVTNSTLSRNSAVISGGGIFNTVGTLNVSNSTVSGNSSGASGSGGGFVNATGATLIVTGSTFSSNTTSSSIGGGAIANFGTATVLDSRLEGNSATNATGTGGAIRDVGTLTVDRCTIAANTASIGGGIDLDGSSGTATIRNSTIAFNVATAEGGGLRINRSVAVGITNTTIAHNEVSGAAGIGGGGFSMSLATTTLRNVTLVHNRSASTDANAAGGINKVSGTLIVRNSIISLNTSAAGFANVDPADINTSQNNFIDGDPLLESLRNNGGPTATLAPRPGSPVIDTGFYAPEVQTLTLSGTVAGTFTLTFNGQTTAPLSGTATDAEVQAALNGLSSIGGIGGSVGVAVAANVYTVTFGGTLSNSNVSQLIAAGAGGLNVVVDTTIEGNSLNTDQRGVGFARVIGTNVDIGAFEMPRPLFTDDFTRFDNVALGGPWAAQLGALGIVDNKAQGTGASPLHIVTLAGLAAADVDLYATLDLAPGQEAGFVARYAGTGESNFYFAGLQRDADGNTVARLLKNVSGAVTELAIVEGVAASGILRFRLVGSTLQMYLGANLLAAAEDTSFKSGDIGLRTVGTTAVDNFQAWPLTTGADNFDRFTHPDNTTLSDPWTQALGFFRTVNNQIQGGQSLNVAVLNAVIQPDVDVQAAVRITGLNHTAGLLARYQGSSDKNFYLGQLTRTATGFTATIVRNVAGVVTTLVTKAISSTSGNANLRFVVTGTNLRLYVNNVLAATVLDNSLANGSVGLRADQFATFDDVRVSSVTTALPFADSFDQSNGTELSANWTRRAGNILVLGNQARGFAVSPAANLATLVGVNTPNVAVQADVNNLTTTGHEIGLVTHFSGSTTMSFYLGRVVKTATGFELSIQKNVAGVVTTLGATVPVVGPLTGPIKFQVNGVALRLFMNGVQQLVRTDDSLISGSVGIRSVGTGTLDNFSAAALNFLPFIDNFTPDTLNANWKVQAGGYSTTAVADKAKGTAALNLLTLNRFSSANVDVATQIELPNVAGQLASLVARYSGSGVATSSMYLANVHFNGVNFVASIQKRINGVTTTLSSTNLVNPVGSLITRLRFTVIGGNLKLFVGGVETLSTSDFSLKSGSAGIRSTLTPTFDDLTVNTAR